MFTNFKHDICTATTLLKNSRLLKIKEQST